MAEQLTFSAADYRCYIKICVAFGKFASEILTNIHALQASAPSKAIIFRERDWWTIGQSRQQGENAEKQK